MKDIEHLQWRATKFILNDFISDYKTRLPKLKLLPLMYIFKLSDIMFFIKSIKCPTNSFNIFNFMSFFNSPRSRGLKLLHNPSNTNKQQHFYFVRICRLWNALPTSDITISIQTIKNKIKSHFWDHFTRFFDPRDPHQLHYLCPCSQCVSRQFSVNYSELW